MLVPSDGGEDITVTISRVEGRLGQIDRKIHLSDGGLFETADNDGVDRMFAIAGSRASLLHRFERSLHLAAIAFAVCVVCVFALYRYGLPVAASFAAKVTPPVVLGLIDSGTLQTLEKVVFEPSKLNFAKAEEIGELFEELEQLAGQKEPPLRLLFRDGGRLGANAFALPGGTIIITDQLVNLAASDDEIAGVLAHEIGHVADRHSMQQIYRALGFYILIGAVTGDNGQLLDEAVAQAGVLQTTAYVREFERAADRHSVELMVRAGRDPEAILALFKRLTAKCGASCKETSMLSTHPGMDDREEDISAFAKSLTGVH